MIGEELESVMLRPCTVDEQKLGLLIGGPYGGSEVLYIPRRRRYVDEPVKAVTAAGGLVITGGDSVEMRSLGYHEHSIRAYAHTRKWEECAPAELELERRRLGHVLAEVHV